MVKDFAEFLDALNKNGASYVVIGGMAVLAHIPYRTTRDIDVMIEPTLDPIDRASLLPRIVSPFPFPPSSGCAIFDS